MKKLFYFLLLILSSSFSFGQSWLWGEQGKVSLKANGYASPVATDKNGNAYITGQYSNTIIFGNDTLSDVNDDAFLIKYNPAGSVLWARQIINSSDQSFGTAVATDKAGNIYITGFFSGNAMAGTFLLTGNNNPAMTDAFLVKYNSNGTVLWAKQSKSAKGYSYGEALSVATDKMGNVFITGYFIDSISFGGITLRTSFTSNTVNDVFLVKYDSNGNVLWARQSEVPSAAPIISSGTSVATDNSGNAYITGYFTATLSFAATTLISHSGEDCGFITKYSSSGNMIWAKQSGYTAGSSCTSNSIITDQSDNPYITGYFNRTASFDSYALHSTTTSVFLSKYDTNGNAIWAKQSTPGWEGTGLASDDNKHIYMAGMSYSAYPDTLKFGNYRFSNNSLAGPLSFIMKFDTAGNPTCGSIINYLGNGALNGVASDSTGAYVYTASVFGSTVICGPDTLVPVGGGNNTFVASWLNCAEDAEITPLTSTEPNIILYPNPNTGKFTIEFVGTQNSVSDKIEVYNILGEKVFTKSLIPSQDYNTFDLGSQPAGIYLYRIISENGELIKDGKFIIQK